MASLLSGSSAMNAGAAVRATDKRKEQMASLTPSRVAIKFAPPTLILEYAPSYGRYLHYKVRMGHLRPSTDPYAVANCLYRDHPRFFDRAKVEFGQTLKLVRKLIDNAGAASPGGAERRRPRGRAAARLLRRRLRGRLRARDACGSGAGAGRRAGRRST